MVQLRAWWAFDFLQSQTGTSLILSTKFMPHLLGVSFGSCLQSKRTQNVIISFVSRTYPLKRLSHIEHARLAKVFLCACDTASGVQGRKNKRTRDKGGKGTRRRSKAKADEVTGVTGLLDIVLV